jgi:hypothetical protein
MRYPIINGELPPMAAVIEYHVVTGLGFVTASYDDKDLAIERMKGFGPECKLIEVRRTLTEITPGRQARQNKPRLVMSA